MTDDLDDGMCIDCGDSLTAWGDGSHVCYLCQGVLLHWEHHVDRRADYLRRGWL